MDTTAPQPNYPIVPDIQPPKSFIAKHHLMLFICLAMAIGIFTSIAATSYFLGQQKQQESKTQSAITPAITGAPVSPVPSQTADLTANWKTYINNVFNYELKYPSTWIMDPQNTNQYVGFSNPTSKGQIIHEATSDGYQVFISVKPVPSNYTLQSYIDEDSYKNSNFALNYNKEVTIGSTEGKQYHADATDGGYIVRIILYDGELFEFFLKYHLFSYNEGKQRFPEAETYFDQILSTFKFTPESPTGGNKTTYTCPSTQYINCMPMVDESRKAQCEPDYLSWVGKNCPGVGITY